MPPVTCTALPAWVLYRRARLRVICLRYGLVGSDGYELLKVDDQYEGMGITSVGTKFYREGELMLSMITEENNRGNRNRNQKGYYEFNTDFAYSNKAHSVTVKQTGYRIDELSGKRKNISKIRKIKVGDDSLQFQQ